MPKIDLIFSLSSLVTSDCNYRRETIALSGVVWGGVKQKKVHLSDER